MTERRAPARTPASTYRLQITTDLDLYAAAERLAYLHDLGVDWVYLSPILAAEPGSEHGYDVVAHDHVDASRGGAEGLAALSREARRLGMGVLVDVVPNHVGVATPAVNPWWWELLRTGRDGASGHRFDVDWEAGDGRVLVPVVGDDDLAEDGTIANLTLVDDELRYHDNRFPLAPNDPSTSGAAGPAGETPDGVHARQHYELVGWRRADAELNYRRFFSVNTLAGIRVEDPEVFAESHAEIVRWFDEDLVDGLRIDHPDGLRDPGAYLDDLDRVTGGAYVLVEKILALREGRHSSSGTAVEELAPAWSADGTTGYDALAWIDRVLTDPEGEEPLGALAARLAGERVDWHDLVHQTKRAVADDVLQAEVRRIVRELAAAPDGGTPTLQDAVAELLACFPVYRSYLPRGQEHLDDAFALARRHRPDLEAAYAVLEPMLRDPAAPAALRFQQTSGMVMAKGVEDCAFYRWPRLTSLNEVGGEPSVFSVSAEQFHGYAGRRQLEWPLAMTALSTHDTKRSEDVRARITAFAEMPERWENGLRRLLEMAPVPDENFGNLLWQAVVGVWPATRERLHAYAEKAMREAGDRTTWTDPDKEYEAAVHSAVDAAYDDPEVATTVTGLAHAFAGPGWSNALAAKLLALTMPGVPDVYQGSELWEQSLVDPDNRRPVDHDRLTTLLGELERRPAVLTDGLDDPGTAKLAVTRAALRLRRDRPGLFEGYAPLAAEGSTAGHALAFDRGGAITVVTRLPASLAAVGGWGETVLRLPEGTWLEQVSGRSWSGAVALADLLAELPVALLAREEG